MRQILLIITTSKAKGGRSKDSDVQSLTKLLLLSSLIFIGITLVLPYLPFVSVFGFVPLPVPLMLAMVGLTVVYVMATELGKKYFYSKVANANA